MLLVIIMYSDPLLCELLQDAVTVVNNPYINNLVNSHSPINKKKTIISFTQKSVGPSCRGLEPCIQLTLSYVPLWFSNSTSNFL